MTNMHKNIGKKARLARASSKNDMIYEIIAVCGNLYICRTEVGELTRIKEEDMEVIK